MAAIDPTEVIEEDDSQPPRRPRSTLKLIKQDYDNGNDYDDDDDSESEMLRDLLMNGDDSEDGDDEEANGGPSDPSKSKKALKAARLQELIDATKDEEDSDEEMIDDEPKQKNNSKKAKAKGKGKEKAATKEEDKDSEEEDESDDESDDMQHLKLQQYTICTLDTETVSLHAPLWYYHVEANNRTALSAAHRPDCWRGREGLLRKYRHPHRLHHRKLCHRRDEAPAQRRRGRF